MIAYWGLCGVGNIYLLHTKGQTIGKMLVGVRIVDVNSGQILPITKVIGLRVLPTWMGHFLTCGIGGLIDSLFIFRDDQRCVHDLIAQTKVVQAEPSESFGF